MAETVSIVVGIIVGIITILTFFGALFSHFVLSPLKSAIDDLKVLVKDISKDIQVAAERRHSLEIEVARIDQSVRSAHHRLDEHISKEV